MKTAIVNLDIINEITHQDGKLGAYAERIASENIIAHINQINQWARTQGHLVIQVRVGFNPHYADSSTISPMFSKAKANNVLNLNDWGCQYHADLEVKAGDIEVIKHRVSAFYGTDLDLICRANRIETLILTGVSTSMAVELTAREAHDRDYQVKVISDATTCASDAEKQASLKLLARISTLQTTQELIA